ncbi:MAG TPA: cytochrome c [Candidatus Polarisedimenticolia bacterium]|nr:cytochrome c [Candidatus Polarisedimenticolia bacterium]
MKRILTLGTVLCAAFALAMPAMADGAAAPADKGKAVFAAQHCSMCHSIEGKGNPKTPLDGVGARLSADQIHKYIVSPKEVKADSKMKAYPSLPAEDLEALVAYISSLKEVKK